ncbi:YdeI family protein [Isoptericola sp. BMS4]|uniref:YdeI/OmpD-associated family protein n=1 Tax=Isoptericola sp. BMS4 TaxID=2527875 RepID=UPI00141F79ED|nr:YdeI/OmpD-associated family protein [Isoptericola sp. BMS4]
MEPDSSSSGADAVEHLVLPDQAAWRAWLDRHEDSCPDGVWLVLAKKGRPAPTTLTHATALDEALCSGWIDAQMRSLGADTMAQRFCPRRRNSRWSARNVEHVQRLTDEGRMRPRGISEVERARADGRWEAAYRGSATIEVPPDLEAALAGSARARAAFAALSAQNRYAILYRLATLRTEQARRRNVVKFVAMLERGETPHPQRRWSA